MIDYGRVGALGSHRRLTGCPAAVSGCFELRPPRILPGPVLPLVLFLAPRMTLRRIRGELASSQHPQIRQQIVGAGPRVHAVYRAPRP